MKQPKLLINISKNQSYIQGLDLYSCLPVYCTPIVNDESQENLAVLYLLLKNKHSRPSLKRYVFERSQSERAIDDEFMALLKRYVAIIGQALKLLYQREDSSPDPPPANA